MSNQTPPRSIRKLALALVLAALPLVAARNTEAQGDRALFSIGRSTNRGRRESLTWFEQRFAYGWEIVGPVDSEGFVMKLSVFGQRPIRVARRGPEYKALVLLRDRPAFLERIFVKTKEGGAIPKVLYVDLHGRDAATGKAVSERIAN